MRVSSRITGKGYDKFEAAVKALRSEAKARAAYRAVVNESGAKLRAAAVKILPGQVGIGKKTIVKAIGKPKRASGKNLTYRISTAGGFISYKFFHPREGGSGAFARPRGEAVFIPRGFMTAGRPSKRVPITRFRGHVFAALGGSSRWGRPIEKAVSDVRIPDEMESGDTFQAYTRIGKRMEKVLALELRRLTRGSVT